MGLQPTVSVTMPVYNAAATVARAVASIRAQTLTDWELIAVDDGSTDRTPAILAELARAEPRLRVLRQAHAGVAAAANRALAAARGRFVARMDADDEAYPERLDAQTAWLEAPENAGCGVAGCLVEYGGDRRATEGYARHVDWINTLRTPEEIAANRFVDAPLANPSALWRRELAERWGGYRDGDFPEDYELWLRWMDAGVRIGKVPRVLLRWNDPPGRATRTDARYAPEAFYRTKAEWVAREVGRIGGGRDVHVWGAGRPTRKRAAWLERQGVRIAGYVDIDPKKWTPALGGTGVPVTGPEGLPEPGRAVVLGYVATRGARELIREELMRRGYTEARDFLLCA